MAGLTWENLYAERIGGKGYGKSNEIYKFEKIKRAKRAALADFPERSLLDFGIGENDEMAPEAVRAAMKREVDNPENRGYADNGIQLYKDRAAEFMAREFGVSLNPVTEVNHCIGSKPALGMLPAAFINPGDITIMTVPGYPVAGTYTKYYGGEVYNLPLTKERNFLPDLENIPDAVADRAKLLVVNYPNSPTGALAPTSFFEKVIRFASDHQLVVVNDAAHMMLTYGRKPLSFLQIDGAKEVGVEVHSMSKGFNMIGWRLGFVCGNENVVRAFADVKDNSDSGQFIAIQKAASEALADPSIPAAIRTKYERRLKKLVQTLQKLGFQAEMPGGTYFLYVPAPKGVENGPQFQNAEDCSQFLIRERSVCTVPWDNAGAFLRFSVTYQAPTEADEDALMKSLLERLGSDRFRW
ncbi:MAG: LL-diaminopimelate aminotransferase [Bdellovibrionota bacterium]